MINAFPDEIAKPRGESAALTAGMLQLALTWLTYHAGVDLPRVH